jgi:hypothetical protein
MRVFHLYGDNIVECERIFDLLTRALKLTDINMSGVLSNISLSGKIETEHFEFVFFPGFGRWKKDVLEHVRQRGGVLREAADCILTEVIDKNEIVLFAVEFCSALPAGNQAWQRSGRAYSFARSAIPYIYLTEIGGYELDNKRNKKAARMPNPAIPFSYISYSNTKETPVLIVYQFSPGADNVNKERYGNIIGSSQLLEFIVALITNVDFQQIVSSLEEKVLHFVEGLAANARSKISTLSPQEWKQLYNSIQTTDDVLMSLSKLKRIDWKKKVSISSLTDSAKSLMNLGAKHGQGITAKDLPISFIPKKNIKSFLNELIGIYPNISKGVKEILNGNDDVAICWINGFKPRGDDARPDRGLLPLLRMLIGDVAVVLTVVYGPAKKYVWDLIETTPQDLAKRNGLWEVILGLSNGLIVDSSTLQKNHISMSRDNWISEEVYGIPETYMEKNKFRKPTSYGENDVDSALHILFKHLIANCFESMCNPPGGDWSGVSILRGDCEYRWLTLPRVSASGSKRPDHIIQILSTNQLLCIESKDYLNALEKGIGPRLNQYCSELLSTPPSCKRRKNCDFEGWDDDIDSYIDSELEYVSAAAYMVSGDNDIDAGLRKSKCDIVFSVEFTTENITIIRVKKDGNKADEIIRLLQNIIIPNDIYLKLFV